MIIYMAFAWLFIIGDYISKAVYFVRHMNAKPSGRHGGHGRHARRAVAPKLAYVPRGLDGDGKAYSSHRARQGGLRMAAWSAERAAA